MSQSTGDIEEVLQQVSETVDLSRSALQKVEQGLAEMEAHKSDPDAHSAVVGAALEKNNSETVPQAIGIEGTPLHSAVKGVSQQAYNEIVMGNANPICGIVCLQEGGGSGTWMQVNHDLQPVSLPKPYFDAHPVYAGISSGRCIIDGQIMTRVPLVYSKFVTPESGILKDKLVRLIAPGPGEGFAPMPAFTVPNGNPRPCFWLGTYAGTDDGGTKVGSLPGKMPLVNLNFNAMLTRCSARNVDGVEGFQMWDVYMLSVLQQLSAIEFGTTNMQTAIGRGRVDTSSANYVDEADVAQASWRGLVGLWGNVWQVVQGIRTDTSRYLEVWARDGSRLYKATNIALPVFDGTNPAFAVTFDHSYGDNFDLRDYFLPKTTSTTAALGSLGDAYWGPSGGSGGVLYLGGDWSQAARAGLFCQNMHNAASYAAANIGCRLAKV